MLEWEGTRGWSVRARKFTDIEGGLGKFRAGWARDIARQRQFGEAQSSK